MRKTSILSSFAVTALVATTSADVLFSESFDYPALNDGDSLVANGDWTKSFGNDITFNAGLDFDGIGGSGQYGATTGGESPYNYRPQTALNSGTLSTNFSGFIGNFVDPDNDGFGNDHMVLFETADTNQNDGYGITVSLETGADTLFGTADDTLIFESRFGGSLGNQIVVDTATFADITDVKANAYYFEGSYDSATRIVELDLYDKNSGGLFLGNSTVTNVGYVWDPVVAQGTLDAVYVRSGDFGNTSFVVDGLFLETVVPEPGAFALIAGVLALGFVARRRA